MNYTYVDYFKYKYKNKVKKYISNLFLGMKDFHLEF